MTAERDVLDTALKRVEFLRRRDARSLTELLHPAFGWTSHTGEHFNRDAYVRSNTGGSAEWHGQELRDPKVTVLGETAILRCLVVDDVSTGQGRRQYRMPMTQVWVDRGGAWLLLAGHAGPLLESADQA
ncbi:nuclear transport factor 2 family protein [uncultured Arthrobacter sp.]|uniref:nuclear transport factor 2 family protein n=1 Tax=uncultured Arthrobacter sp. TaxID=114050 RepID=UPI00344D8503